jgi:hypothetical protein
VDVRMTADQYGLSHLHVLDRVAPSFFIICG